MIQSVERAFSLLYTVGFNKDRVSISQLARDVGLPRTTVVRLLETLRAAGAVKTADRKDKYQLGDKLVALLATTSWTEQIIAVAQPYLQRLAVETGETVYLCLPDGDQVLFATQINCRYKIQMDDSTGQRTPMHIGYIGVAAPIFNRPGEVAGAAALSAPKFRIQDAAQEAQISLLARDTARQISQLLQKSSV